MHPLPRRFATPALFLLLPACGGSPSDAPPYDPPAQQPTEAQWLQANAHPIRTLSAADRDFSDLQPLKAAIGNARVVLLGEPSHGDGTTFLAKARLIAFLHQEMGFDVLAWESGLWDVRQVWQHVQAGEGVIPASRRGIFTLWTQSQEVLPTLDYVQETVGTARPLELAGFDSQTTGTLATDSLHLLMERFARRIGSPVPDDPEWPAAAATLHHLAETLDVGAKPPEADQLRLLRLLAALRADAAAKAGTDRDALYWAQVLESTISLAQMMWAASPGFFGAQEANLRDAQMARNLVWLANVWYPGKKIVVWAANTHVARSVEQLKAVDGSRPYQATGWVTHMGGEVYAALGTQMYAIGFTAATGVYARLGLAPQALPPVPPGSLEARFQEAGMVSAFLDFRSAPAGGEWLRNVFAWPLFYDDLKGDWTAVFDGMVFTRDMTPSTQASR
jgi:erythromycin esterase